MMDCRRDHLGSQKVQTVTHRHFGRELGELSGIQHDETILGRMGDDRTHVLVRLTAQSSLHGRIRKSTRQAVVESPRRGVRDLHQAASENIKTQPIIDDDQRSIRRSGSSSKRQPTIWS